MPHTINGVGTWYYGKRDIHRLKGACEFCNNVGDLTSYDTTLYFVVVFIPVIPISSYRVLQQCPYCEKHRVVKSRQWQEMKNKNTQEVLEPLDKNPKDREALLEGLGSVISYQDPELFEKLIPLANALPDDADVQLQLALTYSYFARRAEATEAFKKSLLAEDRPQTRELMATNLLREGVPDEAEPLVRHILEEKIADKVYLPFLLVETYQSQGKHQQALDMLDDMVAAFPDLENDKDVKKYRKDSTKHLETGKALKRVTLVDSNRAGVEKGSNWSKWVPAIVVLSLLGSWLGRTIWLGSNCKVHLINGGTKPYKVRVNDQAYTLPPGQAVPVEIVEGEVTVETVDSKLGIPPVKSKIETPFFTRCFSRPAFVINPDEAAVLVKETTIFAKNNPPMPPPDVYLPPQAFHELPEPDYVFTSFPQSITVKGGGNVTKTRLGVEPFTDLARKLEYLRRQVGDQDQLALRAKRLAQIDPTDLIPITWIQSYVKPDEAVAFVQTRLDQDPLLVDWHRAYQDLCAKLSPPRDVRTEYEKRLAQATPAGKQNAKYLLGRITDDPTGFEMMREAATGQDGCFQAIYAVGNRALIAGQFDEAKRYADQLEQRDSRHIVTQKLMRDVLMAQGKYGDLEQYLATHVQNGGDSITPLLERFQIAVAQGDSQHILDVKQQILAMVRREIPQQVPMFEKMLVTLEATYRGDAQGFLKSGKTELLAGHIVEAILYDDLKAAEQTYDMKKADSGRNLLNTCLLYLLAKSKKNEKLAQTCWEEICKEMLVSARTAKSFNNMLAGKEPFRFEVARDTYSTADDKRALLLVLADRFPQDAVALRALAAKLNFQHDVYSMAVNKFLIASKKEPVK